MTQPMHSGPRPICKCIAVDVRGSLSAPRPKVRALPGCMLIRSSARAGYRRCDNQGDVAAWQRRRRVLVAVTSVAKHVITLWAEPALVRRPAPSRWSRARARW
uniref:Uncharacterized protein n=1 Tax=Zea mays TaxID=4577 RepID=C0PI91_MAIZE|nr:unknown [Zea mays]|eukprot:NP_001169785.1 uncharacterized protein LOC100383673 [Zea mays]